MLFLNLSSKRVIYLLWHFQNEKLIPSREPQKKRYHKGGVAPTPEQQEQIFMNDLDNALL